MRRPSVIVLLIAALTAAGLVFWKYQDRLRPEEAKKALPLPKGPAKAPAGVAALSVRPGAAEPFGVEDVSAYVHSHRLFKNTGPTADIAVERLEFITAGAVRDRLSGATTGLPDNTRLAFATLRGTFVFAGPPPKAKIATFDRAYALFSASSGNLLMFGTLDGVP